ncbi:MAG TPA: branched-chain amino acid transport system II carrier protein, partial [Paenisporosarcina sp.]|nr:branched-chain amino acid transport system II carrier protein [Paenisporosarcina sp.]
DKSFNRAPIVYGLALLFTSFISIFDGFKAAKIIFPAVEAVLSNLPLYNQGIGWLIPGIIGGMIGFIIYIMKRP